MLVLLLPQRRKVHQQHARVDIGHRLPKAQTQLIDAREELPRMGAGAEQRAVKVQRIQRFQRADDDDVRIKI